MSRTKSAVVKICAGPALGVVVGWGLMLAQYLVEGIMRIDLWHAFTVFSTMGAISGVVVGLFWGLSERIELPAVNPGAPPDSN